MIILHWIYSLDLTQNVMLKLFTFCIWAIMGLASSDGKTFFAPIDSIKVFYFRLMPSFTYCNKKTPYQIWQIHQTSQLNINEMRNPSRSVFFFIKTILRTFMPKRRCTSIYTCITIQLSLHVPSFTYN